MVDFYQRQHVLADLIVEENRIAGYVRGDLFELPAGPVATVFGFEYRDTSFEFRFDNEQQQTATFSASTRCRTSLARSMSTSCTLRSRCR